MLLLLLSLPVRLWDVENRDTHYFLIGVCLFFYFLFFSPVVDKLTLRRYIIRIERYIGIYYYCVRSYATQYNMRDTVDGLTRTVQRFTVCTHYYYYTYKVQYTYAYDKRDIFLF